MKRITFGGNFCDIAQCRELPCKYDGNCSQKQVWERLREYEDTGLYPESVEALKLSMMGKAISEITEFDGLPIDRLRELAEADKDGRALILPCAPDAIYWEKVSGILAQSRFEGLHVYEDGTSKYAGYGMEICAEDIGKTVFLSREEAEKALQKMQGKEKADGTHDKPE